MIKTFRALVALLLISGAAAHAQPVGQIPAGTVWGNSTASRAIAKAETLTAMLDRAFCTTQNAGIFRNASAWVCMTSLPAAMQLNITQLGTITAGVWQGTPIALNFIANIANQRMLANISGVSAAPSETTWTAWMDSVCGSTRGMLAWRSNAGWACLSPGATGETLSTDANDDLVWTAAGTGTLQTLTAGTGISFSSGATCTVNCTIDNDGVTSIAGNTGAFTVSTGITNSTNDLRLDKMTQANAWAATSNKAATADVLFNSAGDLVSLTDAATISVDFNAGFNFTVTLGGNRTLGAPSNAKVGQTGCIFIVQDGTGSRTLAYHANWKFGAGNDPVLTTAAASVDVLCYVVRTSSFIFASMIKDVR